MGGVGSIALMGSHPLGAKYLIETGSRKEHTSTDRYFTVKLVKHQVKLKIQFLSHTSHTSSSYQPHVTGAILSDRCITFPSSQEALLDTAGLGYDHGSTLLRSGRGQDPCRRGLGVGKISSV